MQEASAMYLEAVELMEDDGKESMALDIFRQAIGSLFSQKKQRKKTTTPFGVNHMRSQVLYQAAHESVLSYVSSVFASLSSSASSFRIFTCSRPSMHSSIHPSIRL